METYTLKLAIDDSQIRALEKRLGGFTGMVGSGSSSGGNNNNDAIKNITKLGKWKDKMIDNLENI